MQRKDVLCQVNPDGSNVAHDFPFSSWLTEHTLQSSHSRASGRGSPLHSLERTVRALLLDLDDTLLDDRNSTRTALEAFLTAHHLLAGRSRGDVLASWRSIAARHWPRYEAGEVTFVEQRRCRVREFLDRPLTDDEADEAFVPYRDAYEKSLAAPPRGCRVSR